MQGPRNGLRCGLCTGGVRLYRGTLHGRPIADWKHTDAPPGTTPHRPVLGTPVDAETLDRVHRATDVSPKAKAPPAPTPQIVDRRPASGDAWLADSQSVNSVVKLAELHGWTLVSAEFRTRADDLEYLVVKYRRRDLGAVAIWRQPPDKPWAFDDGWALTRNGAHQVQSTSLKAWLKTRDERCPDCGLSSIVHDEGECP